MEMTEQVLETALASAVPAPVAVRVAAAEVALEGGTDPAFGEVRWRTLLSGDRTASSDLTAGIAEYGPGDRLLPHRHAPSELYYGLSGSGTVTIEGLPYPISEGIALWIPGDAEHGVVAGPEGLRFLYAFPRSSFDEVVYRFTG